MFTSILSTIGASLGGFKSYLYIGVGVAFIALTGTLYVLYGDLRDANEEIGHYKGQVEEYRARIASIQDQIELQVQGLADMQESLDESRKENSELREEIQSARDMEEVVKKKPKLVERRINDATDRVFESISEATGADTTNTSK